MNSTKKLCPQCNSNNDVVKILYGRPSPEGIKKIKQGLLYSGGCSPSDLKWRCKKCNLSFKNK